MEAVKVPVPARLKLVQQPCIKEKVKDGVVENILEHPRDNSRTQEVVYETQAGSLPLAAVGGGGEGGGGGINDKAIFEEKILEGNKLNIPLKFNSNSNFVEFGKLHDNRKSRWLGRGLIVDVNEFGKRRVSWDRVKSGKPAVNWVERRSNKDQNKTVGLGLGNHKAQVTFSKIVGHQGSIESVLGLGLSSPSNFEAGESSTNGLNDLEISHQYCLANPSLNTDSKKSESSNDPATTAVMFATSPKVVSDTSSSMAAAEVAGEGGQHSPTRVAPSSTVSLGPDVVALASDDLISASGDLSGSSLVPVGSSATLSPITAQSVTGVESFGGPRAQTQSYTMPVKLVGVDQASSESVTAYSDSMVSAQVPVTSQVAMEDGKGFCGFGRLGHYNL